MNETSYVILSDVFECRFPKGKGKETPFTRRLDVLGAK